MCFSWKKILDMTAASGAGGWAATPKPSLASRVSVFGSFVLSKVLRSPEGW